MSRGEQGEESISKAQALEKQYDWLKATELYEQALDRVGKEDFLRTGEIQEQISYCFHKAAFQANAKGEFEQRMGQSVEAYEKATEFYGRLKKPLKSAGMLRCEAMIAYNRYWLATEAAEKKRLINECWRLAKETLKAYTKAGEAYEYGKTYNALSSSAFLAFVYEWDFHAGDKIIREAMEYGEKSIASLSSVGDTDELAKTYVKTAHYLAIIEYLLEPDMDEKETYHERAVDCWEKAIELSEETAHLELLSMAGEGWLNIDEILKHYNTALGYAEKTRDKYLIGSALDLLAYALFWKGQGFEDPDERMETLQRALRYSTDSENQFSPISFVNPRSGSFLTGTSEAEYCYTLAYWETDLKKKRNLLEKAVANATRANKQAESTGYPAIIRFAHLALASSLWLLAKIEKNVQEKKELFEKALEHRKEALKFGETLLRFDYWDLGLLWSALGSAKAELSNLQVDGESRKSMLEEAVSYNEQGLQLRLRFIPWFETRGDLVQFAPLGRNQDYCGSVLNRLYELTKKTEHKRKAIKTFQEAVESYRKLSLTSRMAECYWKAAIGYDALSEHLEAAENFRLASTNYMSTAESIPQLKNFYQDYAQYLEAWSEIEKARHHHRRKEYGKAKEHYEKAADLHKSTKRWNYLNPNYSAWVRLEEAEDLSRKEQTEEARNLFQRAALLFAEAKKAIQGKPTMASSPDETEVLENLVKASDIRYEYCLGRIALEEARILDKQGDHAASSEKYGFAAEKFQKTTDAVQDETDKQELEPIVFLSRAWQMMTRAEAEASPSLYLEASRLFDEVKGSSRDEKAKGLALGHSSFCKALEASAKFEATRDLELYSVAKRHMEAAENYYLKAGYNNASEYARASHILLDAYIYMHKAETETEPAKKAQNYQVAEKLLQASAGSYTKAKHPEKSEQTQRLLESIKERRQLAKSLVEVIHAPTVTSTTTSFPTPSPTQEQAVGFERFEHADIQANLLLKAKEAKVGEDIDLRVELVNAGKAPALLVKVDEIVPEGFEIKEVSEIYTVEDRYLNLKGRRLNPLKTEDVKIVVNPQTKGTHTIKPRILYIDETGKYKSHEPEPVTLTVKELGISGWIKGEK